MIINEHYAVVSDLWSAVSEQVLYYIPGQTASHLGLDILEFFTIPLAW